MVDKAVYIMGLNQALEPTQEGFIPLEYNILIVLQCLLAAVK